ncbi:MAG TPA: ion channel [Rhizomicrobium sp.]|jgi:inward rectifier potassium channel
MSDPQRPVGGYITAPKQRGRLAIVKGQDASRWTDFYHAVLIMPWAAFFAALSGSFVLVNAIFAFFYTLDPHAYAHGQPATFWNSFLFSVQTIGSLSYTEAVPDSTYANVLVSIEAFVGIVYMGVVTALLFARFSRPYARVLFSNVAVITPFDGVPTLMFRTANQRGNQVLDASIAVSFARRVISREGIVMRRFEDLPLLRSRTSLFALSWTIMHRIDDSSPFKSMTMDGMIAQQIELVVLLSGRDETLADTIYARHAYRPENFVWNQRFVDVLSISPQGKGVVDLRKFHDTEPSPEFSEIPQ